MRQAIPISVKTKCCEMRKQGFTVREIYNTYFKQEFENPQSYDAFRVSMFRWMQKDYPDETTLERGTYDGFVAHDATVQVSASGEIVQAWIKQKAGDFDVDEFLEAVKEAVEPYSYFPKIHDDSFNMLEIPLFDMHWGISFMDYYQPVLYDILSLIYSHNWKKIVIPFGQDFFHNDSIINGQTTKGTVIEKVDMLRAVKEGKQFIYAIIDAAIEYADEVEVIYSAGNHDKSISWMFMQVLLERYGPDIVDDSLENRKVITYGSNSIMVTHGDSKRATARNLAQIFPIAFAKEFADASVREVHSGHLHHESEADVHGVMVRRLSTGTQTDAWMDHEDFIGSHKRFMLFEWTPKKLRSIHYI